MIKIINEDFGDILGGICKLKSGMSLLREHGNCQIMFV